MNEAKERAYQDIKEKFALYIRIRQEGWSYKETERKRLLYQGAAELYEAAFQEEFTLKDRDRYEILGEDPSGIASLPVESDPEFRAEVEQDACASERDPDSYEAELLSFEWITDKDAWAAINYLTGAGYLFRVTDKETGKQHLALTDETCDFSDGWVRGKFTSADECETWLAELGRELADEEVIE